MRLENVKFPHQMPRRFLAVQCLSQCARVQGVHAPVAHVDRARRDCAVRLACGQWVLVQVVPTRRATSSHGLPAVYHVGSPEPQRDPIGPTGIYSHTDTKGRSRRGVSATPAGREGLPKAPIIPPATAPAGPPVRNPLAMPPSVPRRLTLVFPEGGDGCTGGEKLSGVGAGEIRVGGLPPVTGPWRTPGSGCQGRVSRALS